LKSASHTKGRLASATLLDLRDTGPAAEGPFADLADTRLVVHPDADPVFVEQYRRLAAVLHQAQLRGGIRSVMVASAVAAEGKTLSATNLALMLSHSFRKRVLLVDGDLRKPAVHQMFQLENGIGLTDILKRPAGRLPAHILSPTLSLVTGGQPDRDPVGLLVSESARQLLAQTREEFDWVVVDTPPVVLFPDAGLFADWLDTCVMVVGSATTPSSVAAKAVAAIGAGRILGIVLNRVEPTEIAAGYGYGPYKDVPDGGPADQFLWRHPSRR